MASITEKTNKIAKHEIFFHKVSDATKNKSAKQMSNQKSVIPLEVDEETKSGTLHAKLGFKAEI